MTLVFSKCFFLGGEIAVGREVKSGSSDLCHLPTSAAGATTDPPDDIRISKGGRPVAN